jgi:hypothetical protein
MTRYGEQLGTAVIRLAERKECIPTLTDDVGNRREGFGVIDGRRLAVQTKAGGKGGLNRGCPFLPSIDSSSAVSSPQM